MSTFGRYIFRQVTGALLLILLSLSGVVWIALALKKLNLMTAQGQGALTFLKMTTLALPNMMAVIAPIALLVAVIHTLNRMSGDSELIVLTASGSSSWTIARPLLVLALIVASAVSFVNHVGMPWSLRLLRDLVVQVRTDFISQVIQPGRFTSAEQGLTFHIRNRSVDGRLQGLLMHDTRNAKVVSTYLAERGFLIKQEGQPYLLMEKGHMLRREKKDAPPQIIAFERYVIDLSRFEPKAGRQELKPRQRYFAELAFPDPKDPDTQRLAGHLRAELHERIANPFYSLAFILIVVGVIGRAQSTRQNRWQAIALAGLLSVGARVAGLAANNMVVLNGKWVPLLYAIPLGLGLAGILMMQFGTYTRQRGPKMRMLAEAATRLSDLLRWRDRLRAGYPSTAVPPNRQLTAGP